MNADFLITESKRKNISRRKIAIDSLKTGEKIFPFRYTQKSLEKILFNPKYNIHVIKKLYEDSLQQGITKVAKKCSIDVRVLKMYFLINGLSVEKIYNKRNEIISQTTLSKLDEPYYQELKAGVDFDEVAKKYNFNKKCVKTLLET